MIIALLAADFVYAAEVATEFVALYWKFSRLGKPIFIADVAHSHELTALGIALTLIGGAAVPARAIIEATPSR